MTRSTSTSTSTSTSIQEDGPFAASLLDFLRQQYPMVEILPPQNLNNDYKNDHGSDRENDHDLDQTRQSLLRKRQRQRQRQEEGSWWGGVLHPPTGRIFFAPCQASHVLVMDEPSTLRTRRIGPDLDLLHHHEEKGGSGSGSGKYLGAVLANDGFVYMIPCQAERVLKVDPITDEVTFLESDDDLSRCCCGSSSRSPTPQAIMNGAANDMDADDIDDIDDSGTGQEDKWIAGSLAKDGCIYCAPTMARRTLRIDPSSQKATLVGPDMSTALFGHGDDAGGECCYDLFAGSVADADGCVYFVPYNANTIIKVTPIPPSSKTQGNHDNDNDNNNDNKPPPATFTKLPQHQQVDLTTEYGEHKWIGGVLHPMDGNIYLTPSQAKYILRINVQQQTVSKVGVDLSTLTDRRGWQYGCVGSDNCIYFSPSEADYVLCYDISTNQVLLVGPNMKRFHAGNGGLVWSPNEGAMYGIYKFGPDKGILRITPAPSATSDLTSVAGVFCRHDSRRIQTLIDLGKLSNINTGTSHHDSIHDLQKKDKSQYFLSFAMDVIMERAVSSPQTFGEWIKPWIMENILIQHKTRGLLELFKCLQEHGITSRKKGGTTTLTTTSTPRQKQTHYSSFRQHQQIMDSLYGILPDMVLKIDTLTNAQKEQIGSEPVFLGLITRFLRTDGAVYLLWLDHIMMILLLLCYVSISMLVHYDSPQPIGLVLACFASNLYFGVREFNQIYCMRQYNLLSSYFDDYWNWFDIISIGIINVLCLWIFFMIADSYTGSTSFRFLVAIGALLVWTKFLGHIRSTSKDLATFVMAFPLIFSDLKLFLIVLMSYILMYSNVFFVITGHQYEQDDEYLGDDEETPPFSTFGETIFTVYGMMLGNSDRSWFHSSLTDLLFIVYSLFVQIIIFSMFVAIVCDTYDFAKIRSEKLHRRALVEVAAELSAIGATEWKSWPVRRLAGFIKRCSRTVSSSKVRFKDDNHGVDVDVDVDVNDYELLLWYSYAMKANDNDEEGVVDVDAIWEGRALDQERRTQKTVHLSQVQIVDRIAKLESKWERQHHEFQSKMKQQTTDLHHKMERLQTQNEDMKAMLQKLLNSSQLD